MPRNLINLLIPLAFLALILFFVFRGDSQKSAALVEPKTPSPYEFDPSRFLIRPLYSENQQTAVALDGGNIPTAQGQVPSLVIGKNILRTVHLAWVHDWSHPECRAIFHKLLALYNSAEGDSLPAVKIYLNPVFTDSSGESLHRALLQVYFRSRKRENVHILVSRLCDGTIKPEADAIRKMVEDLDPSLIDDWSSTLEWLESDLVHTFSVATTQQARNTALHGHRSPAQFTSMLHILSPLADDQQIIEFLKDADVSQRAWLQSIPKP